MTTELATTNGNGLAADTLEKVLVGGDLSALSPAQRVEYYSAVCTSLDLNPLTKPFAYIKLNNSLQLYALKGATEQLRGKRHVHITSTEKERIDDLYVVTAYARLPDGRTDSDIGAVSVAGLKGEALANAMMKAITKAKRRVTLSICGLGMLDESEVDGIPSERRQFVQVDSNTGEIIGDPVPPAPAASNGGVHATPGRPPTEAQARKVWASANEKGWSKDQVKGRAAEINPDGYEELDRAEMSDLINAVMNEAPWVDPRQQRLDVDTETEEIVDGDFRDADEDEAPADPDELDISDWNQFWRWAKPKGYANATELCETLGIENRLDKYTPQQVVGMVLDHEANDG